MKIAIAVLLIALTNHAQSRWDHNRDSDNNIDYTSPRPHHQIQVGRDSNGHYKYRHDENHYEKKLPYKNGNTNARRLSVVDPPDHNELIPMARYVIHNADWASIATISTLPAIEGFPFSNVKSMVDGYIANSTGIPYFYMSPLDFTARDLSRNNRATVLATLEETKFCANKDYDAEDPRCTRVMLSGKIKKLRENSTEYIFAKGAMFERHPAMASYPADHQFFVAKLKIAQIAMVDWFGGAKYIPVHEYLAYNYTEGNTTTKQLRSKLQH